VRRREIFESLLNYYSPLLEKHIAPRLCYLINLMLLYLLHKDTSFLVLTSFVLKPDPYDPGTQCSHLHQLLLHERVRAGIRPVARPQGVQLLLVKDRPDPGRLMVGLV